MRFHRWLVGIVFSAGLIVPQASRAAAAFQYLVDAANQIKQIEYSKTVLTQDDNGRIARIACDALKQVEEDPNFKAALEDILSPKRLESLKGPAFDLVDNITAFNAVFVPSEMELMRNAGLQYPAIFDSLQAASRTRVRANLKEVSAIAVMRSVHAARETVCHMAESIVTERQRRAAQWTVGGVFLIAIDAGGAVGIAAASGGTLAIAAGAVVVSSIGIGATVARDGVEGNIP